MRGEQVSTRTALLQRLLVSRRFAFGERSGALRKAEARSGKAFQLDVRQRVVVKALLSRHAARGTTRGAALGRHISYLARSGAGAEGARPEFFDRSKDVVEPQAATRAWAEDRHHFRFIISPEHGDRIRDLRGYVREVMKRVATDVSEPDLQWIGACHFDTDKPHAHVLVRGRRSRGHDLIIPRDYIGYGFRGRAQEVAQELLGDLSRVEAERRIWREVDADRFTGFDRRLLQTADADIMVQVGTGRGDTWAALTRGRLRHLERLGLAARRGDRYRLDAELEMKLRSLELRRDAIRTLNQRRLEGAGDCRELATENVRGQVVRAGFHDELGSTPFAVVRDRNGSEHYARLAVGQTPPELGQTVDLVRADRGVIALGAARGRQDQAL